VPEGSTLLLFAGTSLALLAVPGPAVIYVVTRSLDQGRAAGIVSMLGVEAGTFAYALAAAAGLTGLIAASQTGFTVVKYAGAACRGCSGASSPRTRCRALARGSS
jgi:threonine/homoserine/homoserine lactone efflux protein